MELRQRISSKRTNVDFLPHKVFVSPAIHNVVYRTHPLRQFRSWFRDRRVSPGTRGRNEEIRERSNYFLSKNMHIIPLCPRIHIHVTHVCEHLSEDEKEKGDFVRNAWTHIRIAKIPPQVNIYHMWRARPYRITSLKWSAHSLHG